MDGPGSRVTVRELPVVRHRDKLKPQYPSKGFQIELTPTLSGDNKFGNTKSTGPGGRQSRGGLRSSARTAQGSLEG